MKMILNLALPKLENSDYSHPRRVSDSEVGFRALVSEKKNNVDSHRETCR
jgi:hypothetical protein